MRLILLAGVAVLAGALSARAVAAPINIVQDPGFESATSSGYVNQGQSFDGFWTQTLAQGYVFVGAGHSGNAEYNPSANGGNATVEQVLTTVAGQSYDVSFYYTYDSHGPITATFGGQAVAITYSTGSGFHLATATGLVATSTSTKLDFSAAGANTAIDDVSVTASAPVSTVPAPAGLAVLASALIGLGLLRRTRNSD